MDHTVLPAITPMPAFTSQAFTRWRLPRLRLRISNCSLLHFILWAICEISASVIKVSTIGPAMYVVEDADLKVVTELQAVCRANMPMSRHMEDVHLHTPALRIGTHSLLTLETAVFLFHLLSITSKPFCSLSTRLAHAARLGFFYKKTRYINSLLLLLLLLCHYPSLQFSY